MNPNLKALQDKLQGQIAEASKLQEVLGTSKADDSHLERATALTAEIDATKAQIAALTSLNGASATADEFLNGKTAELISVAGKLDENALKAAANIAPEDRFKAVKRLAARGATPFLCSVIDDAPSARDMAIGLAKWAISRPLSVGGFQASQSGVVPEDGGYLVPEEFEQTIMVLREQYGVFRRYAQVVPMGSDTKWVPRRTGGVTAYFVGESTAITESKAGWDRVQLTARKVGALAYVPSELDEDALASMGDTLFGEIAYAFAKLEDNCGFNGDGTSTYGGIRGVRERLLTQWTISGGAGLIEGAGNLYSELVMGDFHGVQGALPVYAERNAKWYCHKVFWSTVLMRLALASGGVPAAEIFMGGPKKFLGDEVVISQYMPSVTDNSQVPIVYGSLDQAAMFGNRRGVTLAQSIHDKFAEDEIAFRGTQRFDINVHSVVTPGTSEAGPIVGLVMAAS